ncbi:hypothetical protein [Rhodococcus sp. UFZ-B548]|uniref:hypothetical protein n=1 Tax=Rhodococcus sp. UFZ-B548 TaxID=2742212 RepID=UPI0015F39A95|nr:hypothetical protein [Rhodococcus sp. UFZ-B548]
MYECDACDSLGNATFVEYRNRLRISGDERGTCAEKPKNSSLSPVMRDTRHRFDAVCSRQPGVRRCSRNWPPNTRDTHLRQRGREENHPVNAVLTQYEIKRTGITQTTLHNGTRFALAAVVRGPNSKATAEVALGGP